MRRCAASLMLTIAVGLRVIRSPVQGPVTTLICRSSSVLVPEEVDMKIYAVCIAVGLLISSGASYAGRDGAQLMLQDQLNKRAAAERQGRQPTQSAIRACRADARRTCPAESSR